METLNEVMIILVDAQGNHWLAKFSYIINNNHYHN